MVLGPERKNHGSSAWGLWTPGGVPWDHKVKNYTSLSMHLSLETRPHSAGPRVKTHAYEKNKQNGT